MASLLNKVRHSKRKSKNLKPSSVPLVGAASSREKKLDLNDEEGRRLFGLLPVVAAHLRSTALATPNLFLKKCVTESGEEDLALLSNATKALCSTRGDATAVLSAYDEHVWANVLRLMLRDLDPPLIPLHLTDILVTRELTPTSAVDIAKSTAEDLPNSNFDVLSDICVLLRDCASDSERLSHMFGAVLLNPTPSVEPPNPQKLLKEAETISAISKCFVHQASPIFGAPPPARSATSANSSSDGAPPPPPPPPPPRQALGSDEDFGPPPPPPPRLHEDDGYGEHDDDSVDDDDDGENDYNTMQPPAGPSGPISRYVTVAFDYEAVESDEINLAKGETIKVISMIDKDWVNGRKTISDGSYEYGVFPSAFCNLTGEEEFEADSENEEEDETAAPVVETLPPGIVRKASTTEGLELARIKRAIALYDYEPQEDVELRLVEGQSYKVLNKDDPDWWHGCSDEGDQGLFPRIYVEVEYDENPMPAVAPQAPLAPPPPPPVARQAETNTQYSNEASPARAEPKVSGSIDATSAGVSTPKPFKITKERVALCLKYFEKHAVDEGGKRAVPGRSAANFLLKSGLDKQTVVKILELSDIDGDLKLDRDEYIVAHHLTICISKEGMQLPARLPDYLIPKSKQSG
mmetsp:Transcript_15903/g.28313  ORF Transcript_15903/g.28313 Transcript_15903/m.28313 type:complete len:635 (-) Transcript_15903:576-2480(-)